MEFLDLLYAGAPESAFDAVVEASGASGEELEELRRRRDIAVRLREQMERQQSREAQLTALYETANDLIAIRDVATSPADAATSVDRRWSVTSRSVSGLIPLGSPDCSPRDLRVPKSWSTSSCTTVPSADRSCARYVAYCSSFDLNPAKVNGLSR